MISTKRYPEAVPEFEAAIANGGENLALAHKYLGGLWMNTKPQEAADELDKYLKLDPKAPDADKIKGTIKELRSKKQ
jgi:tetratricopeptide (TPR) repeat protein